MRVGLWRTLWGCLAEAVAFLDVLGLFGQTVRGTSTTTLQAGDFRSPVIYVMSGFAGHNVGSLSFAI